MDDTISGLLEIRNEIQDTLRQIGKDPTTTNSLMKITHLMNARRHLYEAQLELERYEKVGCREEDPDGDL